MCSLGSGESKPCWLFFAKIPLQTVPRVPCNAAAGQEGEPQYCTKGSSGFASLDVRGRSKLEPLNSEEFPREFGGVFVAVDNDFESHCPLPCLDWLDNLGVGDADRRCVTGEVAPVGSLPGVCVVVQQGSLVLVLSAH